MKKKIESINDNILYKMIMGIRSQHPLALHANLIQKVVRFLN